MWFEYKSEQTIGVELGSAVNRLFDVTIYMTVPSALLYLDDNFTTVTYYEGRVGNGDFNSFGQHTGVSYINATGKKGGYVNTAESDE